MKQLIFRTEKMVRGGGEGRNYCTVSERSFFTTGRYVRLLLRLIVPGSLLTRQMMIYSI